MSEVKITEVAKAIYALIDATGSDPWEEVMRRRKAYHDRAGPEVTRAMEFARAAIRAMRVPTEEMLGAGDLLCGLTRADVLEIWEAMVDEAAR